MNILLLGSGGREHALAWKIAQSPRVEKLYIAPGNAGTSQVGENVAIAATDFEKIAEIMLTNLKEHLFEKDITLSYDKKVTSLIAEKSYSEKFGARNMRRYVERNVEDKIANIIIENYGKTIEKIKLSIKDGEIIAK